MPKARVVAALYNRRTRKLRLVMETDMGDVMTTVPMDDFPGLLDQLKGVLPKKDVGSETRVLH